jgi:hypothetical protein
MFMLSLSNYNNMVCVKSGSLMVAIRRIADALAEYEAEHDFARRVSLPVEDRATYMPQAKWEGGAYGWFRAPNVVCLEKCRRLKAMGRI